MERSPERSPVAQADQEAVGQLPAVLRGRRRSAGDAPRCAGGPAPRAAGRPPATARATRPPPRRSSRRCRGGDRRPARAASAPRGGRGRPATASPPVSAAAASSTTTGSGNHGPGVGDPLDVGRVELVEAEAGHDGDEIGADRLDPARPRRSQRMDASWTTSSASAALPSMRYAMPKRSERHSSNAAASASESGGDHPLQRTVEMSAITGAVLALELQAGPAWDSAGHRRARVHRVGEADRLGPPGLGVSVLHGSAAGLSARRAARDGALLFRLVFVGLGVGTVAVLGRAARAY